MFSEVQVIADTLEWMRCLRAVSLSLAVILLAPALAESRVSPCDAAAQPPVASVTYYVSTGGDDDNDGLIDCDDPECWQDGDCDNLLPNGSFLRSSPH